MGTIKSNLATMKYLLLAVTTLITNLAFGQSDTQKQTETNSVKDTALNFIQKL